jgi:hypothetical protein
MTSTAIFSAPFTGNTYDGETIIGEHDGFTFVATIHGDSDTDAPWDNEDGHGPVSAWRAKDSKAPGELVLSTDRTSCRFYDFAAACQQARTEGWGATGDDGMKAREKAAHAARADFERLKAWCDDEWSYVGVAVTVSRNGIQLTGNYDHALWGIESDSAVHLTETAEEYAQEALAAAREAIAALTA